MTLRHPTISIVMPSYNHAKFIAAAIDSILQQSFADFELIIVDDGSTDDSVSVIKSYEDDRIVFHGLPENGGACDAMTIALSLCKSELIAVCNSDDRWHKDKLQLQFDFLKSRPDVGAIFSDVEWIDENGDLLGETSLPDYSAIFCQQNRSRHAWLKRIIEEGCCLCHPSVLLKKEVFDKYGNYDNRYRQLPDMDVWLRLLQHYEIHVLEEKLVQFRVHPNNTSRPLATTIVRTLNEYRLLLVGLMETISTDNFRAAFLSSNHDGKSLEEQKTEYLLSYRGVYSLMFNQLGVEWYIKLAPALSSKLLSANEFHQVNSSNAPWLDKGELITALQSLEEMTRQLDSANALNAQLEAQATSNATTVNLAKLILKRLKHRMLH